MAKQRGTLKEVLRKEWPRDSLARVLAKLLFPEFDEEASDALDY